MSAQTSTPETEDPAVTPEMTRLRSVRLRTEILRIAAQVAETQDQLAETLQRLAGQHPRHASRLQVRTTLAEAYAARTRYLAGELQAGTSGINDSSGR